MGVSPVTNGVTTSNQTTSTNSSDNATLDKQAFLQLLVTQLRHQDPMDPLKQEEYAAQLAQFSSVEQLSNLNDRFDQMYQSNVQLNRSITNTLASTIVGKKVRAIGNSLVYSKGEDNELYYDLGGTAQDVQLTIKDSAGNIVRTEDLGGESAGEHSWSWNGRLNNGQKATDGGNYTFEISAKDSGGQAVDAYGYILGKVTGIEFSNSGSLYFLLGEQRVSAGNVHRIYEGD